MSEFTFSGSENLFSFLILDKEVKYAYPYLNPIILSWVFPAIVVCSSYHELATVNVTNLCNDTSVLDFEKKVFSALIKLLLMKTVPS